MSQIVILGSGFASCTAVKTLRKLGSKDAITVISPRAELFYYPSLIWVPSGQRRESDLRVDLGNFYRRTNVTHKAASVIGMDPTTKTVKTDAGEVAYDALIIASGGRYIKKLPGMAEHAHIGCEGWEAIKSFSDKLDKMDGGNLVLGFASNPNEPSAMRGGPVFEYLFGIDALLRKQGRRDKFNITFVSPAPRPGARLGEKAVDRLLGEMAKRGINTHLGNKMKAIEANKVVTEGGEVASDLTLFIPGMTGPAWAADAGLPLSDGGFIQGEATAKVPGVEDVYVAGDAGSFPGPDWKPKQAHMADLQAEAAARNLMSRAAGKPETHTFKTELICIVDSLTTATLVFRNQDRNFMIPGKPFHWAKKFFEGAYLKPYR
ncbi:MAG: FAD-dependent oxidoreductase [Gammaproteobacteria bacterium]|nr:FAD-dependent oxidoreductase [Gammaproteobacteria bacterium]MCP5137552.1 FAD-dependent oxidoreductase [Gammaproteobacteria bacterium]